LSSAVTLAAALTCVLAWTGCVGPGAEGRLAYERLHVASDALWVYRSSCGVYPPTLEALGHGSGEAAEARTCASLAVVDASVVEAAARGTDVPSDGRYALVYEPSDPVDGGFRRYTLVTRSIGAAERTHLSRSFWVSEQGRLRWADGRAAGPADPEVEGTERRKVVLHPQPFLEYPGRLPTVHAALKDAVLRLRGLKPVTWLTIAAQGRDGDASIRWRADVIEADRPLDAVRVRARSAVPDSALVPLDRGFSVAAATPGQAAQILEAVFHELGVRPHDDERDYAIGGEFLP
jgi:hypothetical protein